MIELLVTIVSLMTIIFLFKWIIHLIKHAVGKRKKKDTAVLKKKAKQSGIAFAVCYVITMILGVLSNNTENAFVLSTEVAMTENIEQDKREESFSDGSEEDFVVENNSVKKETEEIGNDEEEEDYWEGGEYEIDPDIAAEWEEWEYTPEEMDEKALTYPTLLEYSYKDTSKGEEIITLIKNSQEAEEKEFSYVLEKKKWFSNKIIYELTVKEETDYIYYGKMKNGKPDGYGVLYYDRFPVYIGEFRKGMKEGYGIDIENANLDDGYFISYEGEFKNGLRNGKGVQYSANSDDNVLDSYYHAVNMYEREILKYYDFRYNLPLFDNRIVYKGQFKEGEYNGEGTLYYGSGQIMYEGDFDNGKCEGDGVEYYGNGQIKYKGEFKNGAYDGKGTLYLENGDIEYKGKFKNGDVK